MTKKIWRGGCLAVSEVWFVATCLGLVDGKSSWKELVAEAASHCIGSQEAENQEGSGVTMFS